MQKVLAEFHPNVAYLCDKYLLSHLVLSEGSPP